MEVSNNNYEADNRRVTDIITVAEVESWIAELCVTLKAGTGKGKSYFIKNFLYDVAKRDNAKILFLVHRNNCNTQFIKEIIDDHKDDVIDIMNYQKLEFMELHKIYVDLSEYKYIVCDEFHYFMSDAAFSKTTDISLDIILDQTSAIKIFMSATGDHMKKYLNDIKKLETIDYKLPIDYKFIKSLTFYQEEDTLETLLEEAIDTNQKAIFFIQSASRAYSLAKKYKEHCLFNCSKNNKDYYKHVDKDKINEMLAKERFEELILITTTCMDAGVNIIDLELHNIVCEIEDTGTLIQCIGRKRIQHPDDDLFLAVRIINNSTLGGKETQLKKKLKMAEFLKTHSVKEFIEEYPREYDTSNMVYDEIVREKNKGTKKVNDLMFYKCKVDLDEIKEIISYGKYGYCKYLKQLFGMESYNIMEEDSRADELIKYLNKIVGKRLLKDEQKELAEKVDIKRNGKLMKSYDTLNAGFLEDNIDFLIKSFTDRVKKLEDGSKNPQYNKVYWLVYKLVDNISQEASSME